MMKWQVLFSLNIVLCASQALVQGITVEDCPAGITRDLFLQVYGEYCYEFVLYRDLEFDTASEDCRSRGGQLVKIFDKATQDFLYKELRETYGQKDEVWIGLSDKNSEDKWEWLDGSLPEFTNWAPGQPGIVHGLEDCAAMDPDDGGLWHDYKCEDLFIFVDAGHRYICQYKSMYRPPPTTTDIPKITDTTTTSTGQTSKTTMTIPPSSTTMTNPPPSRTTMTNPSPSSTTMTDPSTAMTNPSTAMTNPSTAMSNPSTAMTNPSFNMTNPSTTMTNPSTTMTNPSTTMTNPSTTMTNPSTTMTNPTITMTNPSTTMTNPSTIMANPSTVTNGASLPPQTTTGPTTTNVAAAATTVTTTTVATATTVTTPTTTSATAQPDACPPFVCSKACGLDGFKSDTNGCPLCECDV